jgi:small subunit ribosomal protein S20
VSASKGSSKVARTAERKRLRNRLVRSSVKTHIVKAKSSADAGEESAYQKTMLAMSSIDKAVSKGIIHRNKGARLKSRLIKKLNKK